MILKVKSEYLGPLWSFVGIERLRKGNSQGVPLCLMVSKAKHLTFISMGTKLYHVSPNCKPAKIFICFHWCPPKVANNFAVILIKQLTWKENSRKLSDLMTLSRCLGTNLGVESWAFIHEDFLVRAASLLQEDNIFYCLKII